MTKPKILIVGAGPTGLTAAVELARRGIIADVVERSDAPSQFSRAVGILPESMDLLEPSGVAAKIRQHAVTITDIRFHDGAKQIAHLSLDLFDQPNQHMFALAQDRTETFLREAFEGYGGQVEYQTVLTGFEETGEGLSAQVAGVDRDYDYIIGADGISSTVRKQAAIAYPGIDLPDEWSIADVDVEDWPHKTAFCGYILPQGEVVIVVPLEPARLRVIANDPDALAQLPVAMKVTHIRRAGVFKISVRQAERYQKGRVFLAGDAAHCHSPVGGRGMNLGIADAADLARRFADGGLDGYHAAGHAAGRDVIRLSEAGRKALMSRNPLVRGTVKMALRVNSAIGPLNRRAAKAVMNI